MDAFPDEEWEIEAPPGKDPSPDPPSPKHDGEPSAGGADRADARASGKRPLDRAEGVTRSEPCSQRNLRVFRSDRGDAHGSGEPPVDHWERFALLRERRHRAGALGTGSGKSRGEDAPDLVGAAHGSGDPPVEGSTRRFDLTALRNRTKPCANPNLGMFFSDDEIRSFLGGPIRFRREASESGSDSSSSSSLENLLNEEAPAIVPVPAPSPERPVGEPSAGGADLVDARGSGKRPLDRAEGATRFDRGAAHGSGDPPVFSAIVPVPSPERSVAKRSRFQFTSAARPAPDIPADAPRARRVVGAINDGKGSVMPVYAEEEEADDEFEFDAETEPDSTLPPISTWPKTPDTSRRGPLTNWDVEVFLFSMFADGFKLNMEVIRDVLGSCGYDIKKSMEELISFSAKDLGAVHIAVQDMAAEPVVRDEDDYQNYLRDAKQHWDVMKQYYVKAVDAFKEADKNYELYIQEGKHYRKMARLSEEKYYEEVTRSNKSS